MTDRFNSLTVVLEKNIRDDDADGIISAIKHIKGVLTVTGNVSDLSEFVAESRIRHEIYMEIINILYPKEK